MTATIRLAAAAVLAAVLALGAAIAQAQWKVELPEGAVGFKFGKGDVGLKNISAGTTYSDENGAGFVGAAGLSEAGGTWPDALSGAYVGNLSGAAYEFGAKLPNGEYLVWLCAGPIIRDSLKDRHFLLALNGQKIVDETPTDDELASEKYLFRFLHSQYSDNPDTFWANYIDKMYPSCIQTVKVVDGKLTLNAANHFVSALIAMPAAKKAAFDDMVKAIRKQRIDEFAKTFKPGGGAKPTKQAGDGDVLVYVPQSPEAVGPSTGPTDAERKNTKVAAAGAPGQRVMLVLAVVPFADLGKTTLALSDLAGPGTILAGQIRGFTKSYRYNPNPGKEGSAVGENALVPGLTLDIEAGLTQSFWLWLEVPADAKPGQYTGKFTLTPAAGKAVEVPVEFEVYPFKLQTNVPQAYGFWGLGYTFGFLPKDAQRKLMRDRLAALHEIGMTSITVNGPAIKALNADGTVDIAFDPTLFELAKEVGMAANPQQPLLDGGLMATIGRQIGRRLKGTGDIEKSPGAELKNPEFKKHFMDGAKKYAAFIKQMGVPVAVTSVDEPREASLNSWNRNLADTLAYCDMMKEAGLLVTCDPMRDRDRYAGRKDYTVMIDHVDILSTHAWEESKEFMRKTVEQKKVLWLYNTGKDRFSWGFYNWHAKSNGRWEWDLGGPDDKALNGYPGREWQNPYTGMAGFAPAGPPATCKGGLAFPSSMYLLAEGINDYAYIYTLEAALKGKSGPKADEARAFLAEIDKAMPQFPKVKGLGGGAGVGESVQDDVRPKVAGWRATIAGFLKELK